MSNNFDIERELRASLAENARHAPSGDGLVDDIVTAAERQPVRPLTSARRFGAWSMPLLAAAAVAVIAASIGLVQTHPWASGDNHPAANGGRSGSSAKPSQSVTNSGQHTTGPSQNATTTTHSTAPVLDPSGFANFSVVDMTFVGTTQGWALGTADCLKPSSGKVCIGLVRTTDGGKSWHKITNPSVDVAGVSAGCPVDRCATNIRFANTRDGYAFGPGVLETTTDGGNTWSAPLGGGAVALETLNQNVIRVTTTQPGCTPPGCTYAVETAAIGSTTWTQTATLGSTVDMATGVTLSRTGSSSYLDIYGQPAGGAQTAHAALYVSNNNGATWTNVGEACPQDKHGPANGEVDGVGMITANGSITVACQPRGTSRLFTATSTDGGTHFIAGVRTYFGSAQITYHPALLGAASASTLYLMTDQLYRSTNAGKSWQAVHQNSGDPEFASWIGFENPRDGRIVSPATGGHGGTIWTTHNAGASWSSYTFR